MKWICSGHCACMCVMSHMLAHTCMRNAHFRITYTHEDFTIYAYIHSNKHTCTSRNIPPRFPITDDVIIYIHQVYHTYMNTLPSTHIYTSHWLTASVPSQYIWVYIYLSMYTNTHAWTNSVPEWYLNKRTQKTCIHMYPFLVMRHRLPRRHSCIHSGHVSELRDAYTRVMSHVQMRDTETDCFHYIIVSRLHSCRRPTSTHESCHTHEWVMSHTWMNIPCGHIGIIVSNI